MERSAMTERVTLELPHELAQRVRSAAADTHRSFEDALVDLIQRGVADPPVASLSDSALLALCSAEMNAEQQEELSKLLEKNREGQIQSEERGRLDALMSLYRRGLVRKAQAIETAVRRGLKPPLE
jgi:hypothetical protein